MNSLTVTLDVREDIRSGREPLTKIMQTVKALNPHQALVLIAPFQPAPLIAMLANQGFSHQAKLTDGGDWEVLFTRAAASPASTTPPATGPVAQPVAPSAANPQTQVIEVDARGLEPPQPLVKILEALASLPESSRLRAHTDRRPMHLLDQLNERGFVGESQEQADGSFVTLICRPAA
jgi:uncharacterized protein (DUF2249 family)